MEDGVPDFTVSSVTKEDGSLGGTRKLESERRGHA